MTMCGPSAKKKRVAPYAKDVQTLVISKRSQDLRRVTVFLVFVVVVLAGWIIYLSADLPVDYRTQGWVVAWVGYDIAMMVALMVCAWSIHARRQLAIPASLISATLLLTDAWFDMATARSGRDFVTAIVMAILAEIPLATLLILLSRRLIRATLVNAQRHAGLEVFEVSLRRTPLAIFDD